MCGWDLRSGGEKYERIYSLSNCPIYEKPRLTIKRKSGGLVSHWAVETLSVGSTLQLSEPLGAFTLKPSNRPIVFLAAGSGITPIASLARAALHAGRSITLLHVDRTPSDAIFRADLRRLAKKYDDLLDYQPWFTRESGHPTEPLRSLLTARNVDAYLCGPEGFMNVCRMAAEQAGLNDDRILEESFGSPLSNITSRIVTIHFEGADGVVQTIDGREGASLLQTLKDTVGLPSICGGRASCGTCRVAVGDKWIHRLPPQGRTEMRLLRALAPVAPDHRLACQIRLSSEIQDLQVSAAPLS